MLLVLDEVPSTMERAHALAEAGAAAGQAVMARRQREGRGRSGRSWSAETGGLWLSVVCRPDASRGLDALSLRIGLAVAVALESRLPDLPRIDLKWPNDLLLGGRKLAGVLCEARWQGERCAWVVVGLGLNVSNALPEGLRERATRLADWMSAVPTPEDLAGPLAAAIAASAIGGPLSAVERDAWVVRDVLRGMPIHQPRQGVAQGVTADGALIVRTPDGSQHACRGGVVAVTD